MIEKKLQFHTIRGCGAWPSGTGGSGRIYRDPAGTRARRHTAVSACRIGPALLGIDSERALHGRERATGPLDEMWPAGCPGLVNPGRMDQHPAGPRHSATRGIREAGPQDRQEKGDRSRGAQVGFAATRPLAGSARRRGTLRGIEHIWRNRQRTAGDPSGETNRPYRATASYVLVPCSSTEHNVRGVWQRSITARTDHNVVNASSRARTDSRLVNRHQTPLNITAEEVRLPRTGYLTTEVIADVAPNFRFHNSDPGNETSTQRPVAHAI